VVGEADVLLVGHRAEKLGIRRALIDDSVSFAHPAIQPAAQIVSKGSPVSRQLRR